MWIAARVVKARLFAVSLSQRLAIRRHGLILSKQSLDEIPRAIRARATINRQWPVAGPLML
jgi:hypothetical protein